MRLFYKKGMSRYIYEYTNSVYNRLSKNINCDTDIIRNAALTNISKLWSLLVNGLIPVNEYMHIISDIENYTIDRLYDNETIEKYRSIFNNNFVSIPKLTISGTEYNYSFNTLNEMLIFMRNEISLYNANTYGTTYIHETLK